MSRKSRKLSERGAELVEFALVLIPLLIISFVIMNVAWVFFAQATIQYAVQTGVRYAVTGTAKSGMGQDASIKSVVQSNAMGFLNGDAGLNMISVTYYNPGNLSVDLTGPGSNAGGNVVKVSVNNFSLTNLVPTLGVGPAQYNLSATSTDITESSPNGTPPTR